MAPAKVPRLSTASLAVILSQATTVSTAPASDTSSTATQTAVTAPGAGCPARSRGSSLTLAESGQIRDVRAGLVGEIMLVSSGAMSPACAGAGVRAGSSLRAGAAGRQD